MSQEDMLAKLLEQLLESEEKGKNEREQNNNTSSDDTNNFFNNIDIDSIMKLGEIMSNMNTSDKNTQLLLALKPHLRPENRQKVDSALKLMKIMNILPLLKESGILNGLFD